MTTILITAIGGDIAQGAARAVREAFPEWTIVGSDAGTEHGGELAVGHYIQAPRASSATYVDWLKTAIEAERVDLLLPMSEPELTRLADAGLPESVTTLWAGEAAVRLGTDKLATSVFLRNAGIASPWTLPVDQVDAASFPCIFKLRYSAGSKVVFLCKDKSDVQMLARQHPDAVLQEFLPESDREVTCAVFRASSGKVAIMQMRRRLAGGMTGWAEVIDDPAITEQCTTVAETLQLVGCINVQLRLGPSGPRIFEINPRLSSTLYMRHLAGFTDAVWMIQDALGIEFTLNSPKVGTKLVRTYGAAIIPA